MKHRYAMAGSLMLSAALALVGSAASAQGEAGTDAATSAKPAKTGGKKSAEWWGADVTPGWSLMSWKERNEHRKRMRAMKTYDECKAYLDEQHTKMMARATERGKTPMAEPRRDACAGLKS